MIDISALEILDKRKLSFMPVHFSKTKIKPFERIEDIEKWIRVKLKGRYAFTKQPSLDKDGQLKSFTFVGFEDQKEITYFMLACPYLRRI